VYGVRHRVGRAAQTAAMAGTTALLLASIPAFQPRSAAWIRRIASSTFSRLLKAERRK